MEKLRVGVIGLGSRGHGLMKEVILQMPMVEVTAHLNAAGGQMNLPLEQVIQKINETAPWFFQTYVKRPGRGESGGRGHHNWGGKPLPPGKRGYSGHKRCLF